MKAENTFKDKFRIAPKTDDIKPAGNKLKITVPAQSFVVYHF